MHRVLVGSVAILGLVLSAVAYGQQVVTFMPASPCFAPSMSPAATTVFFAPAPTVAFYPAPTTVFYGPAPIVAGSQRPLVGNMTRVRNAPVTVAIPSAPTTVFLPVW